MIVVTGGVGFIGSCIVARLNEIGREDLIIVDHLEKIVVSALNTSQFHLCGLKPTIGCSSG